MIHILQICSNRMWQAFVLFMLIAATACQQGNSQPQKTTDQLLSQEKSPELRYAKPDSSMTFYLTQFSYTPEAWTRMMNNPEDRSVAARKYIESVGGKLHGFWYAFGEYDGYCLWEAPDNISMAAVGIAIGGGGSVSKFETTVLLTIDETLAALHRARTISYRPPGTK